MDIKRTIIVSDLTHFKDSQVCLAGFDIDTNELLRPLPYLNFSERQNITPGCKISAFFGKFVNNPRIPPHIEDIFWDKKEGITNLGNDHNAFFKKLQENSSLSIKKGFNLTCISDRKIPLETPPAKSIITIIPTFLSLSSKCNDNDGSFEIRADIDDNDYFYDAIRKNKERSDYRLKVNDLLLNNHILQDDNTINEKLSHYNSILKQPKNTCYVRIGIGRAWQNSYWFQINGIYVFDEQGKRIV